MKNLKTIAKASSLIAAFIGSVAYADPAITLGEITVGGTACFLNNAPPIPAEIQNDQLMIPIAAMVKKDVSKKLARGTCQFALPIQLAPDHKLIIEDATLLANINIANPSKSRIAVEVFKAGSVGPKLIDESESTARRIKKDISLTQQGVILESACGESLILRGNTSILLTGSARATARTDLLQLGARVVECK